MTRYTGAGWDISEEKKENIYAENRVFLVVLNKKIFEWELRIVNEQESFLRKKTRSLKNKKPAI